ncbi:MAG: winged helix-turn-helix transcriptional regulator [Candidatus Saliniplasma sp.]
MNDKAEALELEVRRDIFDKISKYPGTYLREIQSDLDLPMGQVEYHLNYLEEEGILSSKMADNKKRYFVDEEVDYPDRRIISVLRQRIPRLVLLKLLNEEQAGFSDILEDVDISKSTLSFHLKKLVETGLIDFKKEGRRKIFYCTDEKKIAQVLITYRSSFIDKAVDRFVDTWLEVKK